MRALCVVALVSLSACASHHKPVFTPPPQYAHCRLLEIRQGIAYLSCPPKSYTEEPQLGYRLVLLEVPR